MTRGALPPCTLYTDVAEIRAWYQAPSFNRRQNVLLRSNNFSCWAPPAPGSKVAATGVRSGVIHVPYLPEQAVVSGPPSMALATVVDGLRVAVLTAWQTSVDVTEAGGQVS